MGRLNINGNNYESLASRSIRFWVLLPCFIASVCCALVLLFFLLSKQKIRKALHNHVIIVVIALELLYFIIDVPLYLVYVRAGYVSPATKSTCLVWWISDYAIHETITILVAWATFERHILIFHSQWITNEKRKLRFHYFPIIGILIYSMIFYGTTIFFPPCEHDFHFDHAWCSLPCLFNNSIFSVYQTALNEIGFTSMIVVFSLTLLLRVIWQKRFQLHQPGQWRKHRKMMIQILAMASPYLIFHLPEMIIFLIKPFDFESEYGEIFEMWIDFIGYCPELLLPFTCLAALYPKPWGQQNRIGPRTQT